MERVQREQHVGACSVGGPKTACGSATRRHCRAHMRQIWCTEAASDCCGAEATSTPTGPSVVRLWRQPSDRPEAAGARPALPDFSQCRGATSAPRQRPTPVRTHGGTHRGGVGTPLEGTYFQAEPGNAICVQSLDDSLNSAIHITYHISLRSSSLREPRYPSTGVVVWVVVSARAHTDPARRSRASTRAVGWGGALQTRRPLPIDAHAPLPHSVCVKRRHGRMPTTPAHTTLEGWHRRARGERRPKARVDHPKPARRPMRKPRELVRTGFGMDTGNDPSAGSPTETLLRLLLPLNNKVWTASQSVASGEPAASPQSGGLTGSFNR